MFLIIMASFINFIESANASGQAEILPNHTGYWGWDNKTYHVVGEILNSGDVSLRLVKVTAAFYDAVGSVTGNASSYTMLNVVLPSRKTPFEVALTNLTIGQVDNYTLNLQFEEYFGEKSSKLQIVNVHRWIDVSNFTHIEGEVENLGDKNATFTKVVATFYDADGNVISAAFDYCVNGTIAPLSKSFFEIIPPRKISSSSTYVLIAESKEYSMVPEFSLPSILVMLGILTLIACATQRKRGHVS